MESQPNTAKNRKVRVLSIAGSLRKGSYNQAALRAAQSLAQDTLEIQSFDLASIPLYNYDVEEKGFPEPVQQLKQAVGSADGLLIVTPEYNHSIPGVLKNAIDWVSRPPNDSPLNGIPLGIMGATTGMWGTIRAQLTLRQISVYTNMHPMNKPEVLISRAKEKFDSEGNLTDEATRKIMQDFLRSFEAWVRLLKGIA